MNSQFSFSGTFHKIIIVFVLGLFFFLPGVVLAQSDSDLDKQLREKQDQIKVLEQQLSQAKTQEKTLKSQLDYIDGQTKLTQLKVEEAKFQIVKLEKEIDDLSTRIVRLSSSVDNISEILLQRIVKTYKYSNFTPLDLIFSAHGFTDLLERIKYIEVAQANDKKVLYQLQATKATYNDQKLDKETRQTQQQKLQKDLEKYQTELEEQKKAKQDLLRITQNDEGKFQQEIARLKADTDSISRALAGKGAKIGNVSKGERIASVGNSGCSTGPHLHFETMTPAHVENGVIIGSDNKVNPKPYIDSGQFTKPNASYTGHDCSDGGSCSIGDITTHFGQTYYIFGPGGTVHRAMDIADYYGAAIYAAESGVAYATQDSSACSLTGTVGKGVFVDHQNGIVTLYWHIP